MKFYQFFFLSLLRLFSDKLKGRKCNKPMLKLEYNMIIKKKHTVFVPIIIKFFYKTIFLKSLETSYFNSWIAFLLLWNRLILLQKNKKIFKSKQIQATNTFSEYKYKMENELASCGNLQQKYETLYGIDKQGSRILKQG